MRCEWLRMPDGTTMIVCHQGKRWERCSVKGCDGLAERLCDWPGPLGKTCDKPLCAMHAMPHGTKQDFCPDHPVAQRMLPLLLPLDGGR